MSTTEKPEQVARAPLSRVLQNSKLYLSGNVASRALGFIAIPFYSHFLSPAEYGTIELIEISTQVVAISFGLQTIGTALIRSMTSMGSYGTARNLQGNSGSGNCRGPRNHAQPQAARPGRSVDPGRMNARPLRPWPRRTAAGRRLHGDRVLAHPSDRRTPAAGYA